MEEMIDFNRKKKNNDDLLEKEYENFDQNLDIKPGKRLRVKEKYSKKSDLILKRGRVLESYSKYYFLVQLENEEITCPLSGRLKNIDFDKSSIVVVGDYVRVDVSQHPRIEEIEDRKNALRRYVERGKRQIEVVIAANVDQVIMTTSCSEPPLNFNLVDRYLAAAYLSSVTPIICLNKIDLVEDPASIRELGYYYEANGFTLLLTSTLTGEGINEVKKLLHKRDTLFSGPSGTGKSSLINKLDPSLKLKTGVVSKATMKGKHTTSSSRLIPWSFGGYLIDTPGIKTFGLNRNDRNLIPRAFPGFEKWALECKFSNCHHKTEEGCRVLQALADGELPEERYRSYLNLLTSLEN